MNYLSNILLNFFLNLLKELSKTDTYFHLYICVLRHLEFFINMKSYYLAHLDTFPKKCKIFSKSMYQ